MFVQSRRFCFVLMSFNPFYKFKVNTTEWSILNFKRKKPKTYYNVIAYDSPMRISKERKIEKSNQDLKELEELFINMKIEHWFVIKIKYRLTHFI